jgi:hypothetical protein
VHAQERIEQVGQTDAMRLRNQPEQPPVPIEAPRAALFHYLQAQFVMAVKQLVGDTPGLPDVLYQREC